MHQKGSASTARSPVTGRGIAGTTKRTRKAERMVIEMDQKVRVSRRRNNQVGDGETTTIMMTVARLW
jgi:hypothetical protein